MYHDSKGHFIDLHWHSLMNVKTGKHEKGYWERSFSGFINEIPIEVMGITDQLIHTIVHGIRWNPIPSLRWIADAIIFLENSESSIQWDYLIEQSENLQATLFMFQGLRYLKKEFEVSVPDYVLQSLESFPVSSQEYWNYQLYTKKPVPVFGQFILKIFRYLAYHRGQYPFPGFLRYLQRTWGLKHIWQTVERYSLLPVFQAMLMETNRLN